MDLRSGDAFWPILNGLLNTYPVLKDNAECDVVVIGAGITGALVAYHLLEAGVNTIVIDKREAGAGSTSVSTALLQYEVDTHLIDLIDLVGKEHAERSYLLCRDAILKIEDLVKKLGVECSFKRKKSLYIASSEDDVEIFKREYAARRAIGIDVDFLTEADVAARFTFKYPAALLSHTAAQLDPFKLTHALLTQCVEGGVCVYDRTGVSKIDYAPTGIALTTDRGTTIRAKKIIFAAGYESQEYLKEKVVTFNSSYAFVSEPMDAFPGWGEEQCLMWESARPYMYLRTTEDGRILMGGEDDPFDGINPRAQRLPHKVDKLRERFQTLFPLIDLDVAYSWAGTFGQTKDGLAYIGAGPDEANTYFALGYGGNGITYSVIAAEILRDLITGTPNPDAEIFRFGR
jgi:glycine/D-amino acid oxidase-like deaminating enzyme